MKFGLFLSAQFPPDEATGPHITAITEQAEVAEELGFASLLLGHHYLARSAFMQPVPLLGYLAGRTSRIALGLGVYLLPLHNPLAVAEDLATVDALSGGRLIAGFGVGYREREYQAFGVDYERRFKILDQYLPLLRGLWQGEEVTASGPFGQLDRARLETRPVRPGGPPIWLGAFGLRGITRVAQHDACWLAGPEGDPATLAGRLGHLRGELTRFGFGVDREYPISRECAVAATEAEALDAAVPYLAAQYRGYRSWQAAQEMTPEDLVREHALVGTPDQVLAKLRAYHELGVTQVVARVQWMGMPQATTMRTIRMLGAHVLPEIARW